MHVEHRFQDARRASLGHSLVVVPIAAVVRVTDDRITARCQQVDGIADARHAKVVAYARLCEDLRFSYRLADHREFATR